MSGKATQDGWVMVESSDKMWSTGEGNGKPLQDSCLENPLTVLSLECMFLGSVSRHNKDLERQTLKPSARHSSWVLDRPCYSSQVLKGPCYGSWTNQCYSSVLQLYFI